MIKSGSEKVQLRFKEKILFLTTHYDGLVIDMRIEGPQDNRLIRFDCPLIEMLQPKWVFDNQKAIREFWVVHKLAGTGWADFQIFAAKNAFNPVNMRWESKNRLSLLLGNPYYNQVYRRWTIDLKDENSIPNGHFGHT
jgi:hypothetical protein